MPIVPTLRHRAYLASRLDQVWRTYFADVPRLNHVEIRFGRQCFKRLGTIRRINIGPNGFDTLILINGHFRNRFVPEFVIDATIAHELVHYVHGISSPHPRLFRFPHRGGVVEQEMNQRGLTPLERQEHAWLYQNWRAFVLKPIPVPIATTKPAVASPIAVR